MTSTVRNASVLITGAAQGMGLRYAQRAVAEGARRVVAWDIAADELQRAASELGAAARPGTVIETAVVDLREPEAIDEAAARALRSGPVDIAINNAGIVRGGPYWELADADIAAIMAVNTMAPMRLTSRLLPGMIAAGPRPARIVNVASAAGLLANPNMSVYVASKSATLNWSESVRLELERAGHRHVAVTTLAPSYVDTGMFDGVRPPVLTPLLDPGRVVDAVWRAMLTGRPLVLMPWTAKLGMALRGVLPVRTFDLIADHAFGVYDSMSTFTGRTPATDTPSPAA